MVATYRQSVRFNASAKCDPAVPTATAPVLEVILLIYTAVGTCGGPYTTTRSLPHADRRHPAAGGSHSALRSEAPGQPPRPPRAPALLRPLGASPTDSATPREQPQHCSSSHRTPPQRWKKDAVESGLFFTPAHTHTLTMMGYGGLSCCQPAPQGRRGGGGTHVRPGSARWDTQGSHTLRRARGGGTKHLVIFPDQRQVRAIAPAHTQSS